MLACTMRPVTVPESILSNGVGVLESQQHNTVLHRFLAAEVGHQIWTKPDTTPTGEAANRLARVCISLATRHSAGDDRTAVCAILTLGQLARDVSTLDPKLRDASKILLWELLRRRASLEEVLLVAPKALVDDLAHAGKDHMPSFMREAPSGQCCATM